MAYTVVLFEIHFFSQHEMIVYHWQGMAQHDSGPMNTLAMIVCPIFLIVCNYFLNTTKMHDINPLIMMLEISSIESQKGVNAVQRCSVENRRVLSLYKVYGNSALLVLNRTLSNSINALLTLSCIYDRLGLWRMQVKLLSKLLCLTPFHFKLSIHFSSA